MVTQSRETPVAPATIRGRLISVKDLHRQAGGKSRSSPHKPFRGKGSGPEPVEALLEAAGR